MSSTNFKNNTPRRGAPAEPETEETFPLTDAEETIEAKEAKDTDAPPKQKGRGSFALWRDERRCRKTVRKWRKQQKKQDRNSWITRRLRQMPYAHALGNALYLIGFWAEYACVCVLRGICRVLRAVGENLAHLALMIVRPFLIGLITLCEDIAAPFARMSSGIRHMSELPELMPEEDAHLIRREKLAYFRRGARLYLPVVWNAFSYILPVVAAVFLVVTVQRGFSHRYVLAVQVNGEPVGYVESEQVFESAREDVQSRINSAKAAMKSTGAQVSDAQWEINPTYTLALASETMTESDVTDAILRTSSNEISDGTAVYIDGALSYVTTEGDHLRSFLENIRAPYEDALDTNKRVEFLHDIELVDGVYFTSSVTSYDSIISSLNAGGAAGTYTAVNGDTIQSIQEQTGLSYDNLRQMNPEIDSADYKITAGEQFVVAKDSAPLLQVKTIVRTSAEEDVGYSTVTEDSDQYDYGKKVTVQEGQVGSQETTYDITYINGVVSDTNIVSITRLKDPVNEVVYKGTKLKSGMIASTGSGNWVWPVPNYTYVSRWMSSAHTGADICAPYGVDVLASDSGVVEIAGTHWSYGNYVVINHGNGYKTLYGHMSALYVTAGQPVTRGQAIGAVGSTGVSTGNHCHFEMYYNGTLFSAQSIFGGM